MTPRRSFCLAVLAGLVAGRTHADEPVPEVVRAVRRRLGDDPLLRGTFEQRKSIRGFRQPLVSRGDFIVSRPHGVVWRTVEPFASSLVVTRDRVLVRQADGTVLRRLQAQDEPALRTVSETLFALLSADLAGLGRRFRIEGQADDAAWRLSLVPTDAGLARWLQRVELEGDRFLRTVRLLEASGDQTQIRLGRHATAAALSPQEVALFE